VVQERKVLEIFVDKGMKHNQKIVFSNEGDQEPGIIPGDVVILLNQEEHPVFKRHGMDLFVKREISLLESLCGFSFTLTHLDGRVLLLKSDVKVTKPGSLKEVPGEGMPQWKQPFDKGSLVVMFDVKFPDYFNPQFKPILEQVLPMGSDVMMDVTGGMEVDAYTLREYREGNKRSNSKRREVYEMSDDEGDTSSNGESTPPCTQQ